MHKCERCRGYGLELDAAAVEKCGDCGGHGFLRAEKGARDLSDRSAPEAAAPPAPQPDTDAPAAQGREGLTETEALTIGAIRAIAADTDADFLAKRVAIKSIAIIDNLRIQLAALSRPVPAATGEPLTEIREIIDRVRLHRSEDHWVRDSCADVLAIIDRRAAPTVTPETPQGGA